MLEAAQAIDPRSCLIALLGGEAGLRAGEMLALEWAEIGLGWRQIIARHSDWNGEFAVACHERAVGCRRRVEWLGVRDDFRNWVLTAA